MEYKKQKYFVAVSLVVILIASVFAVMPAAGQESVGTTDSPKLILKPIKDTNLIGSTHKLTATLVDNGEPMPYVVIEFEVVDGPHKRAAGKGETDKSGVATWSYRGEKEGIDTIVAISEGRVVSKKALKTWTKLILKPIKDTNLIGSTHVLTATLVNENGEPMPGVIKFEVVDGPNRGPLAK